MRKGCRRRRPGVSAPSRFYGREAPETVRRTRSVPLCFWLFFSEFPRASVSTFARFVRRMGIFLSAAGGALLFAVHASPLLATGPLSESLGPWLRPLEPSRRLYLYTWAFVVTMILPAIVFGLSRIRLAPVQERRRAGLSLAGIVLGGVPSWLTILSKAVSPAVREWMDAPTQSWIGLYVVRIAMMTIPVAAAYSVLVHHVLDVKLVVRRALQYASPATPSSPRPSFPSPP